MSAYTPAGSEPASYNHLIVAGVPEAHIQALVENGAIKQIVDHEHYNPRIVQALTDVERVEEIAPTDYPREFIRALNDPLSIWDKPFRTHIASRCRHLLFAMFVSNEHGIEVEDLEKVYTPLHQALSRNFALSFGPKDFEEALRTLEGSFVTIANKRVSFINPSVRDYLARYLSDPVLVGVMAQGIATLNAARALHDHFKKIAGVSKADQENLLINFIPLAARAEDENPWKVISDEPGHRRWVGMSYSDRIELLLSWWKISKRDEFLDGAVQMTSSSSVWFTAWADGRSLPRLIASLRAAPKIEREQTMPLIEALEERLTQVLYSVLELDDVQRIRNEITPRKGHLAPEFDWKVDNAANRIIAEMPDHLDHVDSESTLEDYVTLIAELGPIVGSTQDELDRANAAITARIKHLREVMPEEDALSVRGDSEPETDRFDDEDLRNLFASLLSPTV